jgi:urea transporter/murein DD-endopeptidase MepM/ murein hydrolase activator NlpD
VSKPFALCLLAASFTDPWIGFSGLIAGLFAILLATMLGLNPLYTGDGTYTFNSLLTGLALGAFFKFTGNFFILVLISSALSLMFTVWLSALSGRFKLPFLSLPFILTVWIVLLNTRSFGAGLLELRNAIAPGSNFGHGVESLNTGIRNLFVSKSLQLYLRTMAAVFFQNNLLAGLLISIGLLIHSRVAFILSLTGFFSGLLFFNLTHDSVNESGFQLVASSYVLSALALGGFFIISSPRSFLLVILSTPVIGLMAGSFDKVLYVFALPLYSLPFSVAVIIILSFVHHLNFKKIFYLVQYQQYSPEKNLYAFNTFMARFKKETNTIIHLPFFGEWTVSQGHEGALTHKNDWRFAWDFVVKDEHKKTFKLPGKTVADFYCYGLPVLAPADGQVVTVEDGIEDNDIGNVNLAQNWGNTVVIRHSEYLFSKLSHLKKSSFKVKEGDLVKKGELLALCGNSGRSPEPHIHFQLQSSSRIGAPTINYPISYYGRKIDEGYRFNFFDVPTEGEILVKPVPEPLLKKAFNFIPGARYKFLVSEGDHNREENWEVFTDAYNISSIVCKETKATAYFKSDDTLFYFTGFKGNTASLLYYFYLGAYKVLLSPFKNLKMSDPLSIEGTHKGFIKILQDFLSPFYIFLKPVYNSHMNESLGDDGMQFTIVSGASSNVSGKNVDFEIGISDNQIREITINEKNRCIRAKNIS